MFTESQQKLITDATDLIRNSLTNNSEQFTDPNTVKNFFALLLGQEVKEVFAVMFLDSSLRLIKDEIMFRGTVAFCGVHVREIAERALMHRATSIIIGHNHPTGQAKVSDSDVDITKRIKAALDCLSIDTLDHIVVASECLSMNELGMMD